MYATKEKSRDEPLSRPETKEETAAQSQDGTENEFTQNFELKQMY